MPEFTKHWVPKLTCEECKNRIDDTDVEGHYSGECAHCRMSPQTHKQGDGNA